MRCWRRLEEYGGPFQTVLLVGTYHYLFWGSNIESKAYMSHEKILSMVHRLCEERVVFSGRLEVNDCPTYIRNKAGSVTGADNYDRASFLRAAKNFFDVRQVGCLGKYPLFLMLKKNG